MFHALGIAHPGNYDAAEGVTITYEANAEYSRVRINIRSCPISARATTGAVRRSFAATPLAHDIAALQSLYGMHMATRTGDTVYGFNSNAGRPTYDFAQNSAPLIAIWDAGGRDTLDFSGWSSASRIDLEPGASSDGGGQTHNVQIAYGASIENAIGGGGDDTIGGNAANNLLRGGGGNDRLNGLFGTDRAEGGAGGDVFAFTSINDSADYLRRSDGGKWTADVLADFTSGVDRIDLSAIDANRRARRRRLRVHRHAAFTGQAGQLRWEAANGFVHIYGDVNGDGLADCTSSPAGRRCCGDFVL